LNQRSFGPSRSVGVLPSSGSAKCDPAGHADGEALSAATIDCLRGTSAPFGETVEPLCQWVHAQAEVRGFLPSLVARRTRVIGEVSRDVQTCRRAAQLTPVLGGRSSARAADPPARLVARAIGRLAPRLPPLRHTARAGADAPGRQTRPPALSIRLRTRRRPRARRSTDASARQLARQARSRRSSCASCRDRRHPWRVPYRARQSRRPPCRPWPAPNAYQLVAHR
jgi:hypothetical protein